MIEVYIFIQTSDKISTMSIFATDMKLLHYLNVNLKYI